MGKRAKTDNHLKHTEKTPKDWAFAQEIDRSVGELQGYQSESDMKNNTLSETVSRLQRNEEKYEQIFDFLPVGYVVIDKRQGLIAELNLAMTQLLGIERAQLKGKRLSQFIVAENKDVYDAFLKNIFETRHKHICELYVEPKSGSPAFVRLEGIELEAPGKGTRSCQIAVIDMDDRKKMEEELDRQVRQRTAELEHTNALLIAEIEERKKWQKDSELLISELQNAIQDAETRQTTQGGESNGETKTVTAPTLTQQDVLKMKLKDFCDSEIDPVYGSRFWRYVVNSKKSYEPMFPMHELMEYSVQDFCDDMRCRLRIKKHYNNETLEKAVEAFAKYQLTPFGISN